MRGLLAERGIIVAQGAARLRRAVAEILGDHHESVGEILRDALAEMNERLRSFEQRLEYYDQRIGKLERDDKRPGQLMKHLSSEALVIGLTLNGHLRIALCLTA
jgi:hypothetical protein